MSYILGQKFNAVYPHHASIQALWETKWRRLCSMGVYPFVDGDVEDLDKVFTSLIKMDLHEPYDGDAYAKAFFPVCDEVMARAKAAERAGDRDIASQLYLRAACLYRIARFPVPSSPRKQLAWDLGKAAYLRGTSFWKQPITEVTIPHTHAASGDGLSIPVYIRLPAHASPTSPVPCILVLCGLDHYRTDHTQRTHAILSRGWGVVMVEIPGTGDSPAAKNDVDAPDRQWSSVLDWIAAQGVFGKDEVVVWGISTGGYYAYRIAHTHVGRVRAVVSQGGGAHRMFERAWIESADRLEYPFGLGAALAYKFGYPDVEVYKADAHKFSLVTSGLLNKPCARLLCVNGMDDSIFPIDDAFLMLQYGNVKEARFIPNAGHMGNPAAESIIYGWMETILGARRLAASTLSE